MRHLLRLGSPLLACLLTMGGPVHADDAPPSPFPPAVLELLEATGEDGAPIVGLAAREQLLALPEHARDLLATAVDGELVSSPEQLRELLALELNANQMELLLLDNCILCHTNPGMQDESTLFTLAAETGGSYGHLNLAETVRDVHFRRGLSCSGCHGGAPTDTEMADEIYERWPPSPDRDRDRTWIPAFCGRCHADPAAMRAYAPGLPTDQLAKYRTSRHGIRLLDQGDSRAAQCVSCHGVHGIRRSDSRHSLTHPTNIPATCGACHADPQIMSDPAGGAGLPTDQLAKYRQSVHGRALLERGDLGAPACNDCHGNHAAMPPDVSNVSQVCDRCHAANGRLFDGSPHKQAFLRHGWPACEACHGKHDIQPTSDEMLRVAPGGLCYDCHREYAADNPQCQETATHFHDIIIELDRAEGELDHELEALAERGLDVEALADVSVELRDALRESRSRIHSFDRSDFDQAASAGLEASARADQLARDARAEHRFRQKGLLLAILMMGLVALGLYGKLRRVEGR